MNSKSLCILCTFIFLGVSLSAQTPYELNWKKELAFSGLGLGTFGLGVYQRSQTPLYTINGLELLKPSSINGFDKNAIKNYSLSAHHASDYFWYGSFSAPLWFLAGKETRKDIGTIAALWGETVAINSGLTLLTKYTVRRTRPYAYNSNAPMEKKLTPNAKGSFFSGHTSMTAANTFFAAKVFSDYYPDSKWKPVVWIAATTIPAITGYLRVRGGRHFTTDVIVGYLAGASVGYFVPQLHKRKKVKGLSFYGGMNGARLRYQF